MAISLLTVLMSAGIAPGVAKMATSDEPLFLGFQTIFGQGMTTRTLALLACTGLIASFHTIIFAYGRQIYSLSRAGYFPTWLSVTHGKRKTPHRALIAGAALGYAVALAIHLDAAGQPGGSDAAEHGGVRRGAGVRAADGVVHRAAAAISGDCAAVRESRGHCGGIGGGGVALVTLATLFRNPDYNQGVIGAAIWFVLGIAYYALLCAASGWCCAPEEQSAVGASAGEAAVQ